MSIAKTALLTALNRAGGASSDFDLNPDVILPEGRKLRPAGVLVPIQDIDGEAFVILTKRASHLKHHPGQIAFPGGKQDEGDLDVIDAALREATEEIGLPRSHVDVLGTLSSHETVSSFTMTPVIGLVTQPFVFTPEPGEVDEIFRTLCLNKRCARDRGRQGVQLRPPHVELRWGSEVWVWLSLHGGGTRRKR